MIEFFNNIFNLVKETIQNVIDLIIGLKDFLPNLLNFLPNEISILFIPIVCIIIIIFLYRFIK